MSVPSRFVPYTALGCLLVALTGSAAAQTPDLILIHGKILTVDAKDSIVEAVAIAKGKIIAVGSTVDIRRQAARPRGSSTFTVSQPRRV